MRRSFCLVLLVSGALIAGCAYLIGGQGGQVLAENPEHVSSSGSEPDAGDVDSMTPEDVIEEQKAACEPKPNGCGPSRLWAEIIPDCPLDLVCFTDACNSHDTCYATCGSSQAGCDNQFYFGMIDACAASYAETDARFERCTILASVYWQAVVAFGQDPFAITQVTVCDCLDENGIEKPNPVQRIAGVPLWVAYQDDDGDLVPDNWEVEVGLDPADPLDALIDSDSDGLLNLTEYIHATDPFNPDTDGDGMDDAWEAHLHQSRLP